MIDSLVLERIRHVGSSVWDTFGKRDDPTPARSSPLGNGGLTEAKRLPFRPHHRRQLTHVLDLHEQNLPLSPFDGSEPFRVNRWNQSQPPISRIAFSFSSLSSWFDSHLGLHGFSQRLMRAGPMDLPLRKSGLIHGLPPERLWPW